MDILQADEQVNELDQEEDLHECGLSHVEGDGNGQHVALVQPAWAALEQFPSVPAFDCGTFTLCASFHNSNLGPSTTP